jgi:hypothetical protein
MRPTLIRLAVAGMASTLLVSSPSNGAWDLLRKNDTTSLSIDPSSVKRTGDQVSFRYLVDHPALQGSVKTGVVYRSLVVRATIRCKARSIRLGPTDLYGGTAASGALLGTTSGERAAFAPIEAGTSDEELWARVCSRK